jgi:hypothetical protein
VYHAAEHFLAAELHTEERGVKSTKQTKKSVCKQAQDAATLGILTPQGNTPPNMKKIFIFLVTFCCGTSFLTIYNHELRNMSIYYQYE